MSYYVYILQCNDNSLYTGITTHVPQRFAQHQSGTGAKYTRGKGPLHLLYVAEWENRSTASIEEARIKKLSKGEKLALLPTGDPQLLELCRSGVQPPPSIRPKVRSRPYIHPLSPYVPKENNNRPHKTQRIKRYSKKK